MNKNTDKKYPTLKVAILYSLLGGLVGGLPITLMVFIGMLIDKDWQNLFEILWASLAVTFLTGLIPSVLAGILMAYYKIRILSKKSYLNVFFVGWLATFVPAMILAVFANIDVLFVWKIMDILLMLMLSITAAAIFALLGGLTSIILAKFILPKS